MEPIIEPKKSGIIDKNKMQGIDWQIYEKADDGIHVKLVGTKTYQQIFDELTEHLKEVGFVRHTSTTPTRKFPLTRTVFTPTRTGAAARGFILTSGIPQIISNVNLR